MEVTRAAAAPTYRPPRHEGVEALRLQGFDTSAASAFWVGLSHYEPGGGAEWDTGGTEKVYVVIDGELTVITEAGETVLGPLDSCLIERGEARAVENRSGARASMLVLSEYPDATTRRASA
jgi:quercetin dioxygenase-like cupin family protein